MNKKIPTCALEKIVAEVVMVLGTTLALRLFFGVFYLVFGIMTFVLDSL